MKKLTCHCGAIEAEVKIPEGGVEKIMRCNCSICKRKGYIIGVLGPDDFKIVFKSGFLWFDNIVGFPVSKFYQIIKKYF